MLTFDGHTVIVTVRASALAFRTACKPVTRIYLDSRLGSGDFKHPPACWGVEFSRTLELSLLRKEGVRYLQLVNCGGPHADPTTATFDRIPPLSDVRLVLQSEKPPRLTLLPAGTDLTPVYTPAGWEVTVSRVEIHEILRID